MSNMLMLRYAANKSGEHDADRTTPRTPDRRIEYDTSAESRYRGDDGRWKPGTRRSEAERPERDDDHDDRPRQYERSNVVEFPYKAPDHKPMTDRRTSRMIGFGAEDRMDDGMPHADDPSVGYADSGHHMVFDRQTAEDWVRSMENEDKSLPRGGKWKPDMLKPLAQKHGIPTEGPRFWEFYAMVNAMYSDYSEVAKKFGVVSPDFYVCMAKAFMDDKDAEDDKVARYYEYIVRH